MSILLTSPAVIAPRGSVQRAIASSVVAIAASGVEVGVISNNPKPDWFDSTFDGSDVLFVERRGRQDGSIIKQISAKHSIAPHEFIVLGANDEDVQMAKNGGAVLLPAGWAADSKTADYGIAVADGTELADAIKLIRLWPGAWYFDGVEPSYTVRSLCNVSGKYVEPAQEEFAKRVVNTIKEGGPRLQALLVIAARSLLMSGTAAQQNLMWCVYPSSRSGNDDREVLSDFTHRLRTVVSRVRFASRGNPLFVRHRASVKRSSGAGGDRTDPSSQLETLHLNPIYRNKVTGRNVVVLDDCTTYGVSFGVATGLLRAAGAASVSCVALGKFGNQLRYYDLAVRSDPFAPIRSGQYAVVESRSFAGSHHQPAQAALRGLLR